MDDRRLQSACRRATSTVVRLSPRQTGGLEVPEIATDTTVRTLQSGRAMKAAEKVVAIRPKLEGSVPAIEARRVFRLGIDVRSHVTIGAIGESAYSIDMETKKLER